nr:hypothetical protein [uncultured Butyricimonas sp.]DAZ13386.1 MAG TPA: protein of unknown function (UPF0257) [Caudoviricetes sp.]
MRIVCVFVLLFAFVGCTKKAKVEYSDWKYYNLQGKVKSMKRVDYEAKEKFGEIVPEDKKEEEILNFGEDGMLELPSGKTRKIDRDECGNVVKIIIYAGDSVEFEHFAQYNANGLILCEREKYGSMDIELKYSYDGDVLLEQDLFREGKFLRKTKYTGKGDKRYSKTYNLDGELESYGGIFLKNGILRKYLEYSPDSVLIKEYAYDKHSNLIMYKEIESYCSIKYEYQNEYDKKGNIIKQITYDNGVPTLISIRTIEYFE